MVRIGITLLRCYVLDLENEGSGAFIEIWFSPSPHDGSTRIGIRG